MGVIFLGKTVLGKHRTDAAFCCPAGDSHGRYRSLGMTCLVVRCKTAPRPGGHPSAGVPTNNSDTSINIKFQFSGQCPQTMRDRCGGFRYCPNPPGNVPAVQISIYLSVTHRTQRLPCVRGAGKIGSREPILTEGLSQQNVSYSPKYNANS